MSLPLNQIICGDAFEEKHILYKRITILIMPNLKQILRCRSCGFVWKNEEKVSRVKCPICQKEIDARDRTEYSKGYIKQHPEKLQRFLLLKKKGIIKSKHNTSAWYRRSALMRISNGNPKCSHACMHACTTLKSLRND